MSEIKRDLIEIKENIKESTECIVTPPLKVIKITTGVIKDSLKFLKESIF